MAETINNEVLISLVQRRPELWDKTLDIYKNRNATRNAWKGVCCELNKDFEDMGEAEKNVLEKAVVRRWANLRDAFSKSRKKLQDCKKSGANIAYLKKYVYNVQMQFLTKLYDSSESACSLENTLNSDDGLADHEQLQLASWVEESIANHNQVKSEGRNSEKFANRKRRKPDEIELKNSKTQEPEIPNPHMAFFQSVMPHLREFDNSDILEFQMGVLQVIANISEKRKGTQPSPVPYLK